MASPDRPPLDGTQRDASADAAMPPSEQSARAATAGRQETRLGAARGCELATANEATRAAGRCRQTSVHASLLAATWIGESASLALAPRLVYRSAAPRHAGGGTSTSDAFLRPWIPLISQISRMAAAISQRGWITLSI